MRSIDCPPFSIKLVADRRVVEFDDVPNFHRAHGIASDKCQAGEEVNAQHPKPEVVDWAGVILGHGLIFVAVWILKLLSPKSCQFRQKDWVSGDVRANERHERLDNGLDFVKAVKYGYFLAPMRIEKRKVGS